MMLHLAWVAMTVLRFAGVIMMFAGVGLFGVYFIAANARSKNGAIPRAAWLGLGPKKGLRLCAIGLAMLGCAFALSFVMPDGS